MSLREDELYARRKAEARQSVLFFVNLWSNLKTFWIYLITIESAFGCLLAVALTIYVYFRMVSTVLDLWCYIRWLL